MTDAAPMLQQYRKLKAQFPDAILLFRLGDFYEMFDEDARLISKQLGLFLTARRFSKSVKLAMCGVPFRQLTPYVAKLLALGHKVAVADQMEMPSQARKLIARAVVRVITPGTVVEEALLADNAQNYLVALAPGRTRVGGDGVEGWGLAAVDLSTGDFVTAQFDGPEAWPQALEELAVLQPSELLLPAPLLEDESWRASLQGIRPARLSPLPIEAFDPAAAQERLLRHLAVQSLHPFGCAGLPLATAAAGAALYYLQENQLSELTHLRDLETFHPEASVGLDGVTRRNLELTATLRDGRVQGSLFDVLNRTTTPMGARLLRRWIQQPLLDLARITERLDAVEELTGRTTADSGQRTADGGQPTTDDPPIPNPQSPISNPRSPFLRSDLRTLLSGLHDVERVVGRIGMGTANARDLAALRRALQRLPRIKAVLAQARSTRLVALNGELDELADLVGLIGSALVEDPPLLLRDGGLIRPDYHSELNSLRQSAAAGRGWLTAYEAQERERTGIPSLRVRYNQVFGFFVEVPRSKSGLVPAEYERKATISHAERFITPALRAREAEILSSEERANELEYDLFVQLRQTVAQHSDRLRRAARILAEVDVLGGLAETAVHHNYARPLVDESGVIQIEEGRHPVVERLLPEGSRFVANDIRLDGDGRRLLIVTGPNMSGKSVLSRQVALTALMAQMGSFVPARAARIGLVDRIFVRAGASDDITQGRSTFLVEMSETAYILRHATSRSLVVLDEVGRGTSTYDGMALAWAVGEELHSRIAARTLFATHFHELTGLADELEGVCNVSLAVVEQGQEVVFLYRLVEQGADRSYGVQVARLAGVPEHVVQRARELMERMAGAGESPAQEPVEGESLPAPVGVALREVSPVYRTGDGLLAAADDEAVWAVVRELFRLDIANLTPVQALVTLNRLQGRLAGREG